MDSGDIQAFLNYGSIISLGRDSLIVGWGMRQQHSEQRTSGCSFYAPDFFLTDEKPWFSHEKYTKISSRQLQQLLSETDLLTAPPTYDWKQPYQNVFNEAFEKLQQDYKNRTLLKAVPYVFECAEGLVSSKQIADSLVSILKYAEHNPVFIYGCWDDSSGLLGATPELLFRVNENDPSIVETVACAATRQVHTNEEGFVPDEKESNEHTIVIEGIRESLKSFGDVAVGATQEIILPPISHLLTPIQLKTKYDISFEQIVKALHPTPALGAYPKESGRQWLKDYQTLVDRKRFGAPFGCVYPEEHLQVCYVAIRNVQWEAQTLMLGAGCGVVKNSERDKEWEEILLKLNAVKQILALKTKD